MESGSLTSIENGERYWFDSSLSSKEEIEITQDAWSIAEKFYPRFCEDLLKHYKDIEILRVTSDQVSDLPQKFIEQLIKVLVQFPILKLLQLGSVQEVPTSIGFLTNLQELELGGGGWGWLVIPKEINLLSNLQVLRLRLLDIDRTQSCQVSIPNLRILEVDRTDYFNEFIDIGKSANLNEWSIRYSTDTLPYDFGDLPKLTCFEFDNYGYSGGPEELVFPKDFFMSMLNLVELRICGHLIESFPREIQNLVSLKKLDISDNALDVIEHLPMNLTSLNISQNHLTELPEELCYLPLHKLDVSRNKSLRSLPSKLHRCPLDDLSIEECTSITFPPREYNTASTADILQYLRDCETGTEQWH